jgi:4-amino-4-deoxy-L-arabinose transferase-like glycosyltransferase
VNVKTWKTSLGLGGLLLIVSVIIVAFAFTLIPHSGGDNAGYVSLAHGLLTEGAYLDVFDPKRMKHTKYPPVFPSLLAVMIGLGARTWGTLKLAAAVPTVIAVLATYVWAGRRLGAWTGFAIALILSLSSAVIYYSHWVLSDALFLAFTMLALAAFAMAEATDFEGDEVCSGIDRARTSKARKDTFWLVIGIAATGFAYFTRSAGLPMVFALFAWLAISGRRRSLVISGIGLGLPMLAWWLRGREGGVAQYSEEFWMMNPYDPSQGTIDVIGLVPRIVENASIYIFQHGPAGIVGAGEEGLLIPIGLALAISALVGWGLSVRERVGAAEIFFPMYSGLILVWPVVWAGDRFLLPLYPLVFFYGAVAIRGLNRWLSPAVTSLVGALVLLVLVLPAAENWLDTNRESEACELVAEERGPWACYGARVGYFVQAANWSSDGLPDSVSVLTRKPRHFYLLSGHSSRTFPFDGDPESHLRLADAVGASYVLLDQWDGQAARYVGAAVNERPGAFCFVGAFGQPRDGGAQLLGILPPELRESASSGGESVDGVQQCPESFVNPNPVRQPYVPSLRIPLLESLD